MVGPWEVPELKIRECPPSALGNIDGWHPAGAEADDLGAAPINAKKHQWWSTGRCRS
jgi:hypothetical protein